MDLLAPELMADCCALQHRWYVKLPYWSPPDQHCSLPWCPKAAWQHVFQSKPGVQQFLSPRDVLHGFQKTKKQTKRKTNLMADDRSATMFTEIILALHYLWVQQMRNPCAKLQRVTHTHRMGWLISMIGAEGHRLHVMPAISPNLISVNETGNKSVTTDTDMYLCKRNLYQDHSL